MILQWLGSVGPWAWVVIGLVLMALELLAPGAFLIWIGLAAMLTGIIDGLLNLSWQASSLVFAVLSIIAVVMGRKVMGTNQGTIQNTIEPLNQRGSALVGRTFTLHEPIRNGHGQVKIDDSVWRVVGTDQDSGQTVKVVRIDGATLVVEPFAP
jgi:inner membrane protein